MSLTKKMIMEQSRRGAHNHNARRALPLKRNNVSTARVSSSGSRSGKKKRSKTNRLLPVLKKLQLKERGMWVKKQLYVKPGMSKVYVMVSSDKRAHFQQLSKKSVWFHKSPSPRISSSLLGGGSKYNVIKKERASPPLKMIGVVPVVFTGPGKYGDFMWMKDQPEYKKSLFLYNDNVQAFDSGTFFAGGGNAAIRPLKKIGRAFGIPTGDRCGFESLESNNNKEYLEYAFHLLVDFIFAWENINGPYDNIFFSSVDAKGSCVGTGIFQVGEDVTRYVADCIWKVPKALYTKRLVNAHLKAGVKFKPTKTDFFFHKPLLDENFFSVYCTSDMLSVI
jgi:hypothetical protein